MRCEHGSLMNASFKSNWCPTSASHFTAVNLNGKIIKINACESHALKLMDSCKNVYWFLPINFRNHIVAL